MHSFLSSKMDNLKKRWNELEIGTALGDSIGLSNTPPPAHHPQATSNMPASSPSTSSSVSSQQSAASTQKPITSQAKPSLVPTTSSKIDQSQIKRPEEVGEVKKAAPQRVEHSEPLQSNKKDLSNLSSGSSTTTSSYHQSHHDDEEASIQEEEDVDFDVQLNEAKNEEEIIESASSSPILFEKIERPQNQPRTSLRDETRGICYEL